MTDMHLSERELLALTADMQDAHEDSLPAFRTNLAELTEGLQDERTSILRSSRRSILMAGGVALGGLALAACGSSKKSTGSTAATTSDAPQAGKLTGDFRLVGLAAALENAAVYAYGAGITAATAGKLGTVPPAVVTFATTAKTQHTAHAAGWNSVLSGNKLAPVTDIKLDPAIVKSVQDGLGAVKDVPGLAMFALGLEDIAAATYIGAASGITPASGKVGNAGIQVALSIAPVEAQHVAILNFVLGKYPVTDALYETSKGLGPDSFTG